MKPVICARLGGERAESIDGWNEFIVVNRL